MSNRHSLPNRSKKAEGADGPGDEKADASEAVELTESPEEQSEPDVATEVAPAESDAPDAVESEEPAEAATDSQTEPAARKRRVSWPRVVAFGVLPALALLLALTAGYLKWVDNSVRNADVAADESVQVAKDSTVAMLSYNPDTVEQQLNDARNLLTGEFQESYTGLINDVVIPGAKERQISAVASVPAAASVSAGLNEAVVLVFVNQTVLVGQDTPTDTASSVRVTLEKIDGRWLISKFDPV